MSTTGLIVLAPALLTIAVVVWIGLGRPILFSQERGGQDGHAFRYYKFRTMTNTTDANGTLLPDAARLTRLGRMLRTTTLDELPSLWNVLKGDMSIVGPRPLFHEYVALYSERQRRRLETRPGLTSLAVVKGRNALSWEDRFEMDVWYVENRSLALDFKIIILTAWKILKRDDVSHDGHATMTRFRGSARKTTETTHE